MNNEANQNTNTDNLPTSGGLKPRPKILIVKKNVVIALLTLLIVGAVIGVALHEQKPKTPAISPFDSAYNLAVTEGKYAQGQGILDAEIKKSTNNQTTASLYLQKATVAINAKQFTDAMQFAKKADSLAPSSMTASMIADAYVYQGDKAMATKWLITTIQRLDKNSPGYQLDLQDIQQKISDLSQ